MKDDLQTLRTDREDFETVLTRHRVQIRRYREKLERSQNPFRLTDRQTLYRLILPTLLIAIITICGALSEINYCYQKIGCF